MPDPQALKPARIALDGLRLEIEARPGLSLLDAVREAGLAIDSECGGRGTCGECRVRFLEGAPPATAEDQFLITRRELKDGWRLACQAYPAHDCRVLIPQATPRGRRRKIRVLTEAAAPLEAQLPAVGRPGLVGYGAAIDIGTTTVVCYLMDLGQALQVGVASFANPQQAFGPDVISRILYARRGKRELRHLQRRLVSAIEKRLVSLCSEHDVPIDAISTMTAVGNMTMMHLFRGVDPWPLGVAPYQPVFTESPPIPGHELGFRRLGACQVQILPGVGGHLGSDIVAGVAALELPRRRGLSLFMDLGTNGEIVLCSDRIAVGASCAAGPAFEGVQIHSGMAAFPGAVERVDEEQGQLQLDTIGGEDPVGLCGSGLADVVTLLLRRGLLLPSGRLVAPDQVPPDVPPGLRERMQEDESGRRFLLYQDGPRGDIILTQHDVREVQLAKAPMRAGIEILLKETGLQAEAIESVFVAGAFGSSIRAESLLALGVVPRSLRGRIHAVGNTAGLGAKLALTYPDRLKETRRLARSMRHVDLVLRDDFRQAFAENIPFPEPERRD
jgi:uncharacterized 2Fe-2S/4Fe-4S cluster protein (DUF4445 family)